MTTNNKLSMINNPIEAKRKRYNLIGERLEKIRPLGMPGQVEYDEGGMAARFFPNIDPRRRKAEDLMCRIRAERREIRRYLIKHGYSLA